MDIVHIHEAVAAGLLRITDHAVEEMAADTLSLDEVLQSTRSGEIIEDYPHDHPLPSCLICGQTDRGDYVHSVWAYNEKTGRAIVVTVYRPDPTRWLNWRVRNP